MSDSIKEPSGRVVEDKFEFPTFSPSIPDYMLDGMDKHNKFLLEQLSIMKQQNEWQTDMTYKIYNYTKKINGKVVELEHFRHRMEIEMQLDTKWDKREEKLEKIKKIAIIAFLTLGYPLYLAAIETIGIGKLFENLLKI